MKEKVTLTDREARRLSKWKTAKELEALDIYLHYRCVKASQGTQCYHAKGSGYNDKVYDVMVEPGQFFTTYSRLCEEFVGISQMDENRIKTLLGVLSNENHTKFNVQDVLKYSKGCTKINVQGVPNLGILISLADITDKALFEKLEKDPNYVQNLMFMRTKNNVRSVQNSISNNTIIENTKKENTNIDKSTVLDLLLRKFHPEQVNFISLEDFGYNSQDYNAYLSRSENDKQLINYLEEEYEYISNYKENWKTLLTNYAVDQILELLKRCECDVDTIVDCMYVALADYFAKRYRSENIVDRLGTFKKRKCLGAYIFGTVEGMLKADYAFNDDNNECNRKHNYKIDPDDLPF